MYTHIKLVLSLRHLGALDKNKKDAVKQLQCLKNLVFHKQGHLSATSPSFSEKNCIPDEFDKHKLSENLMCG